MIIESPSFKNGENIPSKFTCDGENINPELRFKDVPKDTKSLALIMDDPDIPQAAKDSYGIDVWDHWVVFNIPPETSAISENSTPNGVIGVGTRGVNTYTPPCPPDREHRYFFKLYALDTMLLLDKTATKNDVLKEMEGHILAEAELVGLYQRK
jgi:Raf kinase inhibitor-like YbhB/YbcL family protein